MADLLRIPTRVDQEFKSGQQQITICGKIFVGDQTGALYWPGERMLVVADLHFEKGSAFARRGSMLPPYDTKSTLQRLARVIDYYDPDKVVALGDSLHDVDAGERIAEDDLAYLRTLQVGRQWVWLTGNHDPEIPASFGGICCDQMITQGIKFRHEPSAGPTTHEIAGHLHPAAKVALQGYKIRRPCFVSNGRRLVLPAFGTYAGGLNVLDTAFDPLFGTDGIFIWMLGQEGIYPVASRQLRND